MKVAFSLALAVLAGACAAGRTTSADWADVEDIARARPETRVLIAYENLASGERWDFDGDELVHAASTMKVPVIVALYALAHRGALDLDSEVLVENRFKSIVDGSVYSLEAGEDGDPELYERVGGRASLRELARRMIVRSSNLATNLLIEVVGAQVVQATIRDLGARHMEVLRGVEDQKAFDAGLSNTATANDLARLLVGIADGRTISPEDSSEIASILEAQEFNELIPAGLPPGTRVAHKTGQITGIQHDAAIVMPADAPAYVLVVLTSGFRDPGDSADVIRRVAAAVHERHLAGS